MQNTEYSPRKLAILGSTGSIGTQSLDVVRRNSSNFELFALAAGRDVDTLVKQCAEFQPAIAAIADEAYAAELRQKLQHHNVTAEVWAGDGQIAQLAGSDGCDTVIAGITGAAGLSSIYQAVCAGKRVLLANKESLVMAGRFIMSKAIHSGAEIIPLDSEHNAVFQCLNAVNRDSGEDLIDPVDSIILTASGGPFLHTPQEILDAVTPEQASTHPKWRMGRKISVDSATLMNKGLEVIEAHWLFGLAAENISVLIHPQSLVHAMVKLRDGSILAQMAAPDMRVPISNALGWPQRIESGVAALNFLEYPRLDFMPVDEKQFPCIVLAYDAMRAGKAAPLVLNAANETAVEAFLESRLKFTDIFTINRQILDRYGHLDAAAIDEVFAIDKEVRAHTADSVARLS